MYFSAIPSLHAGGLGFQDLYPGIQSGIDEENQPTWPANPLEQAIESEAANLGQQPGESVSAPTCARQPNFANFFSLSDLNVSSKPTTANADLILDAPAKSVAAIFKLLRTTEIGRAILDKFAPRYGFDIRVKPFQRTHLASVGKGTAEAVFDIEEKTIYVDLGSALGKVAFVFLHEVVHSLDEELASGYRKEQELREEFERELKKIESRTRTTDRILTVKERIRLARARLRLQQFQDVRLYRAERFAYDASYKVWQELAYRFPKYYQGEGKRPAVHTDAWLVQTMGLRADSITLFQKGKCTVLQRLWES